MYCHACGADNPDGVPFCRMCGAALRGADATGQNADRAQEGDREKKKQATKRNRIIAAVLTAVVVVIIVVGASLYTPPYVNYVRTWAPFEDSDLYYSYDMVCDRYLDHPTWKARETNGAKYVDVTGRVKDGSMLGPELTLTFNVKDRGNGNYEWGIYSIAAQEGLLTSGDAAESVWNIFYAYSMDMPSLIPYVEAFGSDYGAWTSRVWDMAVTPQRNEAARYALIRTDMTDTEFWAMKSEDRRDALELMTYALDDAFEYVNASTTLDEIITIAKRADGWDTLT